MQKTILAALLILVSLPASAQRDRKVKVITEYGTMVIRLYDQTPLHRDNFVKLVKRHFYDSLLFHRVIRNFMIQGGDPDSKRAAAGPRWVTAVLGIRFRRSSGWTCTIKRRAGGRAGQ